MKTKIDKTIKITMILTEEEALWLKGLFQNPIHDDESYTDNEMREKFWKELNNII